MIDRLERPFGDARHGNRDGRYRCIAVIGSAEVNGG
jgi:hypothetical protein